jgi:methyl-accepting chemotaxis protein
MVKLFGRVIGVSVRVYIVIGFAAAAVADDLSKRTEHQAATLEETAAAISEITATVKSSATIANEALATSREAKTMTEKGGDIVQNAVTSMTELQTSSDNISNITNVIEEIAFQTNLLTLNAGVEAMRGAGLQWSRPRCVGWRNDPRKPRAKLAT